MPARGHSPRTELLARRAPNVDEAHRGADVVFDRRVPGKSRDGVVSVLAYYSPVNGSYTQYGAHDDVLWDNVVDVEEWADEVRQLRDGEADVDDNSLVKAIQDVLDSADDTGCTDDLIVVSKAALERLEALANA